MLSSTVDSGHAQVYVRHDRDALEVEVVNDGRATADERARRFRLGRDTRANGALWRRARARSQQWRRLSAAALAPLELARAVIRVLIADDQALVRGGFRLILDSQPDMLELEIVDTLLERKTATARAKAWSRCARALPWTAERSRRDNARTAALSSAHDCPATKGVQCPI